MEDFNRLLKQATSQIDSDYYQLPIAGTEVPIYRERVYCYELYHQLRCIWCADLPFKLGGEIDKRAHPLIKGGDVEARKPDFLVHIPGRMDNAIVMEVKSSQLDCPGLLKDLRTLTAFRRAVGYKRGILLIFGSNGYENLKRIFNRATSDLKGIEYQIIELWIHDSIRHPARPKEWPGQ